MMQQFAFTKDADLDIWLIQPFHITDQRGGNMKDYSREVFLEHDIDFRVLENLYISSKKYVLRGLHFQHTQWQSRLVRCLSGEIFAVAVDVQRDSPTCGRHVSRILSAENETAMFVPEGFAFGTLALEDSLFACTCGGAPFMGAYASGIAWNDPVLHIDWPLPDGVEPVIADKDQALGTLKDYLEG